MSYSTAGSLELWATGLAGSSSTSLVSWDATATKKGVRLSIAFPAGTTFAGGKTLAAAVGAKLRAGPQKALAVLAISLRNDKLDLGVASVSVPGSPAFSFAVPYVAPVLDAKRTKATGPDTAFVVFAWAPTNRPPAVSVLTLTPVDPTLPPVVVPLEAKAGGALSAELTGLAPAMAYSVAVTVTGKGGGKLTDTVGTAGLATITTTSPAGLATAVRFTTVIDGYTRAQHDAALMANYRANLQNVAPGEG